MASDFTTVSARLRSLLQQHAGEFVVSQDTATRFALAAPVGPATLRAWGGRMRSEMMPVAWVEIGKAYVSYHHMAFYGDAQLRGSMSKELRQRMQGKTCFNFKNPDEKLFAELAELTARGCQSLRRAGFIQ